MSKVNPGGSYPLQLQTRYKPQRGRLPAHTEYILLISPMKMRMLSGWLYDASHTLILNDHSRRAISSPGILDQKICLEDIPGVETGLLKDSFPTYVALGRQSAIPSIDASSPHFSNYSTYSVRSWYHKRKAMQIKQKEKKKVDMLDSDKRRRDTQIWGSSFSAPTESDALISVHAT
jgi:hypothetical protein